ncbi:piezo-type mechanosensitive ion channel component-like [Tachypleus tridentatus]|uniref:piezo-type mechanosensitive ion channel component-like n=1 Tax=Tachypleus tridentatus TaxID=6853 RepID=UPI003FD63C81
MADRPESDRDWLLVCVEGQKAMQQEATDRKTDETGRSQDSEDLLGSINQYGDVCKPDEQKSEDRKTSSNFCRGLFRKFFVNLLSPEYRVTVDVYALMFLCEFVNFLIVVFGYWAFGTDRADGGVASYVEENKVPVPFLIMLIAQFALIVIDRALYLCKCILGKLIFKK